MKKIDFIYKNFDVNAFSKNLKKIKSSVILSLSDYLSQIVISSTRDISQIKKEINYYQFTKDKPNDELSKANLVILTFMRNGKHYLIFI